jgi:hypothetical protein
MRNDPFERAVARAESASDAQLSDRRRDRVGRIQRKAILIHAAVFSIVQPLLFGVWLWNWRTGGDPYPWFVYPLLGWGAGLAAHYLAVRSSWRRTPQPTPVPDRSRVPPWRDGPSPERGEVDEPGHPGQHACPDRVRGRRGAGVRYRGETRAQDGGLAVTHCRLQMRSVMLGTKPFLPFHKLDPDFATAPMPHWLGDPPPPEPLHQSPFIVGRRR